ncbi:hypothetical protein PQX77_005254 [Marasmius sp. AFHP31]|nr:hypothetical protein PQX77_005254 [Marasmius sp. AFHP31]
MTPEFRFPPLAPFSPRAPGTPVPQNNTQGSQQDKTGQLPPRWFADHNEVPYLNSSPGALTDGPNETHGFDLGTLENESGIAMLDDEDDRCFNATEQNAGNASTNTHAIQTSAPQQNPTMDAQDSLMVDSLTPVSSQKDVVLRLQTEKLTKECQLLDWQSKRLVSMTMISSELNEDIPMSLILGQVYQTAAVYETANRQLSDDDVLGGYRSVLKEMNMTLSVSFKLLDEHRSNIRALVRYKIWDPFCTDHHDGLEKSVMKYVTSNAEALTLSHAVKAPYRLGIIEKFITETSRSVRNNFRAKIRDSVDVDTAVDVLTWIQHTESKYVFAGAAAYSKKAVFVKVLLLRAYIVANPHLVWDEEPEGSIESEDRVESTTKRQRTLKGGAKTTKSLGGRVAKGEDFWTKFDGFLKGKVDRMGGQLNTTDWRKYIEELYENDTAGFPGRVTASVSRKRKEPESSPTAMPIMPRHGTGVIPYSTPAVSAMSPSAPSWMRGAQLTPVAGQAATNSTNGLLNGGGRANGSSEGPSRGFLDTVL